MIRIRRLLPPLLAAASAVTLTAGCDTAEDRVDKPPADNAPASPGSPGAPGAPGSGTSPLDNPDGTAPGLAPLTSAADREAALGIIDRLATESRGSGSGYDRDEFGYAWMDTATGVPLAGNGCDTRNDLLRRDGRDVRMESGDDCLVETMELADPYAGKDITFERGPSTSMDVQIDHVVPLSYAWQMGAGTWPEDKRKQLANDPLNLLAVDGDTNSSKGDSGPESWLPPAEGIRCAYGVRFAQVARKYELPVTTADKETLRQQCGT
ncbi:HNH endonuclease family protein [Streptomyces sp. NBC_01808]|uniref:HNH endonuclease family protein n=1 Tax=Streptomyces sp. NBC_01808 TaxID=2975947 RepID=UPI002DDABFA6|nr:HNH endonuclease family protein [Streptomyces sp. NBC_01808]WSA38218.1 HNH endonuclease family protein [Streptomyces sp. NBC_01808]